MEYGEPLNLWSKFDYSLVEPSARKAEPETEGGSWRRRLWFAALDLVATLLWLYVMLQVFVVDVDRAIFGSAAQFRLFIFLAAAALIAIKIRSVWGVLAGYAYIIGFPFVVACWKLPRALYRSDSGLAFLVCANVLGSAADSLRRAALRLAVFAAAAFFAAIGRSTATAGVAALFLAGLLLEGLFRTIRASAPPAPFVRSQRSLLRKVDRSRALREILLPKPLQNPYLERFDASEQRTFLNWLWFALLLNRGVALWAVELRRCTGAARPRS